MPAALRAIRAPSLAGLAAAVAMSPLGPVAPDGVLGFVITASLAVMIYQLVPGVVRHTPAVEPVIPESPPIPEEQLKAA